MPLDPIGDESVSEIDARIEEQLSIIVSIDAQMADRSAALRDGNLSREDFIDWSVRASDRRSYAASDLVSLRYKRHRLTQEESSLRVEAARLREENDALRVELSEKRSVVKAAETIVGTERQNRVIESLRGELAKAHKTITALSETQTSTDNDATVVRVKANERITSLKYSLWHAFLKGEVAVLHVDRAKHFLSQTRSGVPREVRDAYCEREVAYGYPRPRTSAECEAEKEAKDE